MPHFQRFVACAATAATLTTLSIIFTIRLLLVPLLFFLLLLRLQKNEQLDAEITLFKEIVKNSVHIHIHRDTQHTTAGKEGSILVLSNSRTRPTNLDVCLKIYTKRKR